MVLLVLVFQCTAATFGQAVGAEITQKSLFREDGGGCFFFCLSGLAFFFSFFILILHCNKRLSSERVLPGAYLPVVC